MNASPAKAQPDDATGVGRGGPWALALGVFVVAAVAITLWQTALPSIPDFDSYYHLAVARLYRAEGFVRGLAWARPSLLGERLGDKELLFHLLLPPFATPLAHRQFFPQELEALLHYNGFEVERVEGGWEGEPLDRYSDVGIWTCRARSLRKSRPRAR